MNDSFVPLSPAAAGQNRSDFRVAIVSPPENLQPFRPLGHAGNKSGAGDACEPRVTLQRDGGRVTVIRIQCACGQVIELACVYPTPPAAVKG